MEEHRYGVNSNVGVGTEDEIVVDINTVLRMPMITLSMCIAIIVGAVIG